MEEEFNKLKQQGKNDLESIIKWMKDSKIVEPSAEDKVRKLFSEVQDTANIEFPKFQEVVAKLAAEQKKTVDELSKSLVAEASKMASAAFTAAASALK